MKQSKLDQRIRRADELAAAHPFAADVLHFYKHLANFQKALYVSQEEANGNESAKRLSRLAGEDLNFEFLLPKFPQFLSAVEAISPDPLAQSALELKTRPASRWSELFSSCWCDVSDLEPSVGNAEALLARAFLQPYAEFLADHSNRPGQGESTRVCPFCRAKPLVGVLRPEGDGAKRSLICSLCLTEWNYGRIRCPACGEEAVERLAIYTADQFPHVRVEACDTCRRYLKTVDLTKNGLAIPVVDELATIPLNLWAQEHHYLKLQPNLLGI
jgi:FdhE protein